MKPLHNYVCVELIDDEKEQTTSGGLVIAVSDVKKPFVKGVVKSVGPTCVSGVEEGQLVVMKRGSGVKVELPLVKTELLVLDSEIIAVL